MSHGVMWCDECNVCHATKWCLMRQSCMLWFSLCVIFIRYPVTDVISLKIDDLNASVAEPLPRKSPMKYMKYSGYPCYHKPCTTLYIVNPACSASTISTGFPRLGVVHRILGKTTTTFARHLWVKHVSGACWCSSDDFAISRGKGRRGFLGESFPPKKADYVKGNLDICVILLMVQKSC